MVWDAFFLSGIHDTVRGVGHLTSAVGGAYTFIHIYHSWIKANSLIIGRCLDKMGR